MTTTTTDSDVMEGLRRRAGRPACGGWQMAPEILSDNSVAYNVKNADYPEITLCAVNEKAAWRVANVLNEDTV